MANVGFMRKVRRITGSALWFAGIFKPSVHLLSIPGYLDDGLEWISVLQSLCSLMTSAWIGCRAAFVVVGVVMVFWPDKAKDASKPARPLGKSFSEQYASHAHAGTVTFDYSNNDGRYRIGQGEQIFKMKWGRCSGSAIYLSKDSGSLGTIAVTDKRAIGEIEDASVYNGSSNTRCPRVGEVAVQENAHGFWAAMRIINIEYKNRGSDHDELTFRVCDPDQWDAELYRNHATRSR